MLDGVGWAALEIVVFMVAATLVGFAIGWVFVGWLQRASIAKEYEAELAAQQELVRKAEYRLSESNKSLDKLHLELRGESERARELEAQLAASQATVAALEHLPDPAEGEAELAAARSELEAAKSDLDSLQSAFEGAKSDAVSVQSELEAVKSDLDSLQSVFEGAKSDAVSARSELEAAKSASAKAASDLEECRAGSERLSARVGDLEERLAARDAKIAALKSDLDSASAVAIVEPGSAEISEPPAPPEPVAAVVSAAAKNGAEAEPTKEEGLARIAEIADRTAGGSPAADDDLKKVHGIGPKLERTLKGLGITSFRQIANFQTDDIAFVTAALDAFKGRIERDDWMSSAASEHLKKYNESA